MLKSSKFAAYIGVLTVFWAAGSWADTHYVRPPETCTNTTLQSPYTSWANAATQVQWAVTEASAGETVLVSNGTYTLTQQVSFAKTQVVLQSVNGRDFTFVNGNYSNTTNRCFKIEAWGVVIDGFTITNGFASSNVYGSANGGGNGGGIHCNNNSNVVIKNCTISKNIAAHADIGYGVGGGGIWTVGSGSTLLSFTMSNCIISFNTANSGNGGGFAAYGTLINCDIISNKTLAYNGAGGGVQGCILDHCRIYGNSAKNCDGSQGGGGANNTRSMRNCLVYNNSCDALGGGVFSSMNNSNFISGCTIVSNYASGAANSGGGLYLAGTNNYVYNSIIYSNRAANGAANIATNANAVKNYLCFSCTSSTNGLTIYNCITNSPDFIGSSSGNYRLANNSPCINTGTNEAWMINAADLDGRVRIRYGTVDMGAYERISAGTIVSGR